MFRQPEKSDAASMYNIVCISGVSIFTGKLMRHFRFSMIQAA